MVRLHTLLAPPQGALRGIGTAAGRVKKAVVRTATATTSHHPRHPHGIIDSNNDDENELARLRRENKSLREQVLQLEAELRQHRHLLTSDNNFSILRPDAVTVGKKLGQGGFGWVYRGQWRGVPCALKFINQSVVDELLEEVKIMDDMCEHPNICRMYGVVLGDTVPESWPAGVQPPCLVMEYLGYEYDKRSYSTFVDYLKATKELRGDEKYWIGAFTFVSYCIFISSPCVR